MFTFNHFQNGYFADRAISESTEQHLVAEGLRVRRYETEEYREICNIQIPDQIVLHHKYTGEQEETYWCQTEHCIVCWKCIGDDYHWIGLFRRIG